MRIPAGRFNEKHKHAHETLIHLLAGSGQVVVDGRALPVRAGDTVLVPRWSMHQTQNLGDTELRYLAVTDFGLTRCAYLGGPTDYRMGTDIDAAQRAAPAHGARAEITHREPATPRATLDAAAPT